MKIFFIVMVTLIALFIGGCATNKGPEYDGRSYSQMKKIQIGTIVGHRPVVISDTGTGSFLGAIVGGVLGSTVGRGNGRTLATLAGGLAGSYAGGEVNKSDAQELTVELNNSNVVVVVTKGNEFHTGDRVQIIKDGNNVAAVKKLQ